MTDEEAGLPAHEREMLERRRLQASRRFYRRVHDDKGQAVRDREDRHYGRVWVSGIVAASLVIAAITLAVMLPRTPGSSWYDQEAGARRSIKRINAAVARHDAEGFERHFDYTRVGEALADDYRAWQTSSTDFEEAVRTMGEREARSLVESATEMLTATFLAAVEEAVVTGEQGGTALPFTTFCGTVRRLEVRDGRAYVLADPGNGVSGDFAFEMEYAGDDLWRVVRIDLAYLMAAGER